MSTISVFGMGYVGVVTAGCLTKSGHKIIGVDLNQTKIDLINKGKSPIIEKDTPELITEALSKGLLSATTDTAKAIAESEISLICVGTPSQPNGNLDLKYIVRVCEQIGAEIKKKDDFHVVVCRSTVLPGSMRNVILPTLEEHSGKKAGVDFGLCNNPEFLREGTAVYDFYNPPKIVIGQTDPRSGDLVAELYTGIDTPMIRTDVETAEMVKYADNVWHALKICFANEIGKFCKAVNLDGHKVMDIFCKDDKLNLSGYYLKPGFAFGGSCLPKDVRAIVYKGKSLDVEMPVLNAILPSNVKQIEQGFRMVTEQGNKKIGVLGFSFKAGTDDLRESPIVELVERLIGKGYQIKIYDANVSLANLLGANKEYILNHIPHLAPLMVKSPDEIIEFAETIIIGNGSIEFRDVIKKVKEDQVIIDLVKITDQRSKKGKYEGICW